MSSSNLHIVFNFFEKITKPPEQASYLDGMKYIYEYVRKEQSFILGQLHKNIDPNGLYPYVNYVGFSSGDFVVFQQKPPTKEWRDIISKGVGMGEGNVRYPGGYNEIATLSGNPMVTNGPKSENSAYLLINYKESEVGDKAEFEADWKNKTGTNILTELLKGDVKYGEVGLYRRLSGQSPFLYTLRCEILDGPSNERILQELPAIREKLSGAKIPYNNVSAYNICLLVTPASSSS